MARTKPRQRISYVLPLANSAGGHRLGVNGLDIDSDNSILYSGGRDGVLCAWDLHVDLKSDDGYNSDEETEHEKKTNKTPPTTCRQQVQAHTHWINDIALAQNNQALLSASSDITVKIWRPCAGDGMPPQTIGLHSDYVKTLAVPSPTSDWFVSGGLDRKIYGWDLTGGGQTLCINVDEDEAGSLISKEKGSVYALAATHNILASGGPEGTVRVWDARDGRRITKLVGHTDNIRDILVAQDGNTILTASSDRTVKVWSTTAGRCMNTFTMHDASVWSLYSRDPTLGVFYSSDRTGIVAKTDTRYVAEMDDGLCVSICQENEGVHKIVASGGSIWAATSRPSINQWKDVNTDDAEIDLPESYAIHRASVVSLTPRHRHANSITSIPQLAQRSSKKLRKLPLKHMLRLSVAGGFPIPYANDNDRRGSVATERRVSEAHTIIPHQAYRSQPEYSIEGQTGLIKHVMLNDRKTVLTLDTAGEVVMWDLLKCVPIKSFGKRHLDDVKEEAATVGSVANWCTVDTRTGSVAVILEEHTCFDAEMYADELELDQGVEYRDDQRINFGKWILRYLFDGLISEEVKRDEDFRKALLSTSDQKRLRDNAPTSIQIPRTHLNGWQNGSNGPSSATTLKPNGIGHIPSTPGIGIAAATPNIVSSPMRTSMSGVGVPPLPSTTEEGVPGEKREPRPSHGSADHSFDYFSKRNLNAEASSGSVFVKTPMTPADESAVANTETSRDAPKEGMFGKKFRMGMNFGSMRELGRVQTNDKEKIAAPHEEQEGSESGHSSRTDSDRIVDENLLGTVQKLRFQYEDDLQSQLANHQAFENGLPVEKPAQVNLMSSIRPALPEDAPVLRLPPNTTILIQEERPEAGGVADLFEGTVGSLASMCDVVERVAPMWLGDVLLRNTVPIKDVVKIAFVLEPWQNLLPAIATDGNNRLNANRMLRAKKILAYVAERIEPPNESRSSQDSEEVGQSGQHLELYCNDKIVPSMMTLATIRAHLWRGGGDIILHYKSTAAQVPRLVSTTESEKMSNI